MRLADLPTPCLVLDRGILERNIGAMARALARQGVPLRPHMKTAKSIDVARLATTGQPGGIAVSTLAETEYFAGHGITDILYAVGITPQKLDQAAKLNSAGAAVIVLTDDLHTADAIAAHRQPPRVLIEIDTGEGRGGVAPDDPLLLELADRLGPYLAGVLTHAGHSYAGRTPDDMERIAETERAGVTRAAERLRSAGHATPIVSMGSSPTARHARHLEGVTEVRAGVYMFGDLFQAEIGTHDLDSIALTVLTSVIGRRPGRLLVDAGGLALSRPGEPNIPRPRRRFFIVFVQGLDRRVNAPLLVLTPSLLLLNESAEQLLHSVGQVACQQTRFAYQVFAQRHVDGLLGSAGNVGHFAVLPTSCAFYAHDAADSTH